MIKNMNKRATKFLTVSSVSSDSIVKGIIDDIALLYSLLQKRLLTTANDHPVDG
jgi:hypothetical protein